ncbi:MAG: hypothetical protein ACR2PQ_12940 [Myxococcota bacterium]
MKPLNRARLLALFAAIVSCATAPGRPEATGGIVDPATLDRSDVIPYRALARSDFRGKHPPPAFAQYADQLGAATCAQILSTPDTQLVAEPSRGPDGRVVYRTRSVQLGFHAQMDRNCSWWNPRDVGLPEEYILEHEQIHFALFELEARRLNRVIPELEKHLHATAESPRAAIQIAQQQLERELQARMQGILARSREFDEDTSMGHRPEQQRLWWDRVHSELE